MNQLYFTINLNKYGELRQQEVAEQKTFLNFAIFFIICLIILFGFVFYLNHDLKQKLESRVELYRQIEQEVKSYQASGDYLSTKDLERLATTSTERVFWARKLVALSENISSKIAVTHFTFKNEILSLYGITKVDVDEKEFDLIDDFIKILKQNEDISEDFPEIKFVRSSRDREKDADILRFQIDCMKQAAPRRRGSRS